MQPGEEIESLVDELEQIVNEAKSPLMDNGQKKIVDAQDVYEILDEIRRVFPQEFQDARRIIKEEQETLDRAQQQASSIIADAQQQAMILAGNLKSLTSSVSRVRQTLDENSGPRNTTNNVPW